MMATTSKQDTPPSSPPLVTNGVEASPLQSNTVNGSSSSDDEVRKRTKSSVSRTDPHSRLTPPTSHAAIEKIKQRIDFTNDTEGGADNETTPTNEPTQLAVSEEATPIEIADEDDDQEINNSVSVSALLSRLDTVRGYIEDAEQLYEALEGQPDSKEQLDRISQLIKQLKTQELNYLQVLLKVMEDNDEEHEESKNNESLSLRAELNKEEEEEEEDEESEDDEFDLMALQEQHELLKKLLEQQQQMELLHAKQAQLLLLKKEAEERLAAVEVERDNLNKEKEEEEGHKLMGYDIVSQLEEMKERRAHVEKLLQQIQSIKNNTSELQDSVNEVGVAQEVVDDVNTSELVTDNDHQHKTKLYDDMKSELRGLHDQLMKIESAPTLTTGQTGQTGKTGQTGQTGRGAADSVRRTASGPTVTNRQELLNKRDELKQLETMLDELQLLTDDKDDESVVQRKLEDELTHQKELYSTLMRKTAQLQQLQKDIEKLSRGSDHEGGAVDTTGGTWGGSDDEDDIEQSTATIEDKGRDNVVFNYRVDKHTPKTTPPTASKATPSNNIQDDYLREELVKSSDMCKQLIDQQTLLLTILHQRLDTLPYIQEQMLQLQQYHNYLQGYNEYLNNAYWQLHNETTVTGHMNASKTPVKDETTTNSSLQDTVLAPPPLPFPPVAPSLGQFNSPFIRPHNPHLQYTPKQQQQDVHGLASSLPASTADKQSQFEGLRDLIYSEVAALIAQNEERPHYLVELFSKLQLLNNDYLRQRGLYSIQDITSRLLTEDMSETRSKRSNSAKFDYVEKVESASSLSTPPPLAPPNDESIVLAPLNVMVSGGSSDAFSVLDETVKLIMMEVIPLLKEHLNENCNNELLHYIQESVMNIVMLNEDNNESNEGGGAKLRDLFIKQIEISLSVVIGKYINKRLGDIGEDLLVDISEVLFNELSYYHLLKEQDAIPDVWKPTAISPQRPPVLQGISLSQYEEEEKESLGKTRDDELAITWHHTIMEESHDKDIPSVADKQEKQD